ncbi:MAG TPA: outer membrane lipoprotein carrier protein LolA [Candidatus Binatia bacterium]
MRTRRHLTLTAVAVSWILAAAATALADAPAQSLAARARRFPAFSSARAAFEQERQVSLVDEILRASGTIALRAPDHMRLELTAPETLTIAVDGDALTVLDARGTPIAVPPEFSGFARFGHVLTDLMLGQKAPDLFREEWHGPDAVTLRTDAPEAPFSDITLHFPAGGRLPTEIVMRERGGDTTTIRMHALPDAKEAP